MPVTRASASSIRPRTPGTYARKRAPAVPTRASSIATPHSPVAGKFAAAAGGTTSAYGPLITLNLNPLDLNLLGLEVKTNQIKVTVSAQPGKGELLGNLLTDVPASLNLQGVNTALNNVLGSVVTLLNSTSLNVSGVNTDAGPLSSAAAATTPVLDLYRRPGPPEPARGAVDTSPIHLTITAHSGAGSGPRQRRRRPGEPVQPAAAEPAEPGLRQRPAAAPVQPAERADPGHRQFALDRHAATPAGTEQVLSLTVPPINVNLLGLVSEDQPDPGERQRDDGQRRAARQRPHRRCSTPSARRRRTSARSTTT